ncbi:MAG: alpha/beta fold hydrolase [Telluria sp.]
MKYTDVFYTSDDGLRLYARDYAGPEGAPSVLCLPGLTRNSKDFAALAEELSGTYRVVCPDQRGRGRSARDPQPERYRPERYVLDMLRLLDVLRIDTVSLVGTSLGGLMSILLMAQAPGRIRAAVLNDVGPEIDPRGIARISAYVGKLAPVATWEEAVARSAQINGPAFPHYSAADWQAMARSTYVMVDGVPVSDYDPAISQGVASGSAAPSNLWPLFERCARHPMLAIRGETSDILAASTLEQMQQRMARLQAVTIRGVGHAPMLDEPDARQAIRQFLEEHA